MSLISELEQIKSTLNECRKAISVLIQRWNNGEIDSSSESDEPSTSTDHSCVCSPHADALSCDEDVCDLGALSLTEIPE